VGKKKNFSERGKGGRLQGRGLDPTRKKKDDGAIRKGEKRGGQQGGISVKAGKRGGSMNSRGEKGEKNWITGWKRQLLNNKKKKKRGKKGKKKKKKKKRERPVYKGGVKVPKGTKKRESAFPQQVRWRKKRRSSGNKLKREKRLLLLIMVKKK